MATMKNRQVRRYLTLLASCIGFVVVILDVSVVNVALESLQTEFNSGVSGLEWVVDGYTLTFAAFLLTAGALGDRLGPKPVFQTGFVIFAFASLACSLSGDLVTLIVARIVQGIGAALLVPASLAILNQTFPDRSERSRAVGLWAAAGGLALAVGPVFGGILISQWGWRSIFMMNVPITAVGIWLTARNAPTTRERTCRTIDWFGQITAVLALGGLTAAIIEAANFGWEHPLIIGCGAVSVLATLVFLYNESRSKHPMLPLNLFQNTTFSASSLIGIAVNFAFYGLIFMFSLFFQTVWHYSPLTTGLAFLPMTAAIMGANIVAGRLTARHGPRPVLLVGCLIAAAGYITIIPFISTGSYQLIAIQFLVAGTGIGLAVPSMTNAMLSAVDLKHIGIASGVLNASRQLGGLLGVATTGLLLSGLTTDRFLAGMDSAVILASILLAASALLTALGVDRDASGTRSTREEGVDDLGLADGDQSEKEVPCGSDLS